MCHTPWTSWKILPASARRTSKSWSIGDEIDVGLYRELVRNMGVAEYVHKPLTRDQVTRLFVPQIAGVTMDASAPAAAA